MRQHPWSWNSNPRVDQRNTDGFRQVRTRRPWSPPQSIASHRRGRRNAITSPHDHDRDVSDSETRLCEPSGEDEIHCTPRSISGTSRRSTLPSPSAGSSLRIPLHHEPGIIPSPISDMFQFPSSSSSRLSTEVAAMDVDGTSCTQANLVRGRER